MCYAKICCLFDLTRFDNVWRMILRALHVDVNLWVAKKWNPSLVTPCHKKNCDELPDLKFRKKRPCMEKWCSTKTTSRAQPPRRQTLAMITTLYPKVKRKLFPENHNFSHRSFTLNRMHCWGIDGHFGHLPRNLLACIYLETRCGSRWNDTEA